MTKVVRKFKTMAGYDQDHTDGCPSAYSNAFDFCHDEAKRLNPEWYGPGDEDFKYWNENLDSTIEIDETITFFVITFPNEQAETLFLLKWS